MPHRHLSQQELFSTSTEADSSGPNFSRRTALLGGILGLLGVSGERGESSPIDPKETIVVLPKDMKWTAWPGLPPHSGEMATLYGGLDKEGPYVVLMKWHAGY